jgi:hypothetical protein
MAPASDGAAAASSAAALAGGGGGSSSGDGRPEQLGAHGKEEGLAEMVFAQEGAGGEGFDDDELFDGVGEDGNPYCSV